MVEKDRTILFRLPLTTATGKTRVKRREDGFGEPVPTATNNLDDRDYFEWQISYFVWLDEIWNMYRKSPKKWIKKARETFGNFKSEQLLSDLTSLSGYTEKREFIRALKVSLKKHNQIVIEKPHKNGREFVINELADLFRDAWKKQMVSEEDIEALRNFNTGAEKVDIEASYKVKSELLKDTISDGFECYAIHTPLFIKKIDDMSFVEIAVKHKQRAVGFQSMVYFGFYLKGAIDNEGKTVIGRTARKGEHISIEITKEHLIALAKAFIIASESHSWDMKKILDVISNE